MATTTAAAIAPEVSNQADDTPDRATDNHNDSSSSSIEEAEAEQNVSNQTVILAANDAATDSDSINVKDKDEVKVGLII